MLLGMPVIWPGCVADRCKDRKQADRLDPVCVKIVELGVVGKNEKPDIREQTDQQRPRKNPDPPVFPISDKTDTANYNESRNKEKRLMSFRKIIGINIQHKHLCMIDRICIITAYPELCCVQYVRDYSTAENERSDHPF